MPEEGKLKMSSKDIQLRLGISFNIFVTKLLSFSLFDFYNWAFFAQFWLR